MSEGHERPNVAGSVGVYRIDNRPTWAFYKVIAVLVVPDIFLPALPRMIPSTPRAMLAGRSSYNVSNLNGQATHQLFCQ